VITVSMKYGVILLNIVVADFYFRKCSLLISSQLLYSMYWIQSYWYQFDIFLPVTESTVSQQISK